MQNQPADGNRPRRVAALIKKEIAQILSRELNDPRLTDITITAVEVPRDLATAKVFFTSMSAVENPQQITSLLNKAAGFVCSNLRGRLELRIIPKIRFLYDDSIQRGDDLNKLLHSLRPDEK